MTIHHVATGLSFGTISAFSMPVNAGFVGFTAFLIAGAAIALVMILPARPQ